MEKITLLGSQNPPLEVWTGLIIGAKVCFRKWTCYMAVSFFREMKNFGSLLRKNKKIFCIGFSKTGTTSMGAALKALGFRLGNQAEAELLIEDWARRDFRSIIRYCKTADAFQDIPFCLPYTYQALDSAFPGSKFILTVRDSSDEWYKSLIRFHTKIVGKNRTPTACDLKEFSYRYQGWIWRAHQLIYDTNEDSPYQKGLFIEAYEAHNRNIQDYFRHRQDSLLILNLSCPSAMEALCSFLGLKYEGQNMPHLNRSGSPAE
jgi:hypothetical protein